MIRREFVAGLGSLLSIGPALAQAILPGARRLGASGGLPRPPAGYAYLLNADGSYVLNNDGSYVLTVV